MDGGATGALRKNSREKGSSLAPTCSPRAPPSPRQKVINAATEASALGSLQGACLFLKSQFFMKENTWEGKKKKKALDAWPEKILHGKGAALLHWTFRSNKNIFHFLSIKLFQESSSSPPRDTNCCVRLAAVKTKVGREKKKEKRKKNGEGSTASLAPEGAGWAAKLCPPTSPPVSAGEHSLPKQTPRGQGQPLKSCPRSPAKPTQTRSHFPPPQRSLTFSRRIRAGNFKQLRAFLCRPQPVIYCYAVMSK